MAGIIKATGRMEPAAKGSLKAFHFDDVGQSYVGRVRAEAARLIADAQKQATQIKAQAKVEGRQAAIDEAKAALNARLESQMSSVLAALGAAAEQITHARHAWQRHWELHAIELATAIARRVCRQELSHQPSISLSWIREALEMAAGNGCLTLRLCPDDHATLAPQAEALVSRLTGIGAVQIVPDPSISPGGCRVDTEFGSLDQQLETQLARIAQELPD